MKPHHKRMLEWVASQLDTSLKIQEVRDFMGRRVRRISFDYVPEEYEEDWGEDFVSPLHTCSRLRGLQSTTPSVCLPITEKTLRFAWEQ